MLTGHGCFNVNLFRFRNATTIACSQCGVMPNTAEHAVFKCDALYHCRATTCVYLGVEELTAENIVGIMLRSKEDWDRVSSLVKKIMSTREVEERVGNRRRDSRRWNETPGAAGCRRCSVSPIIVYYYIRY